MTKFKALLKKIKKGLAIFFKKLFTKKTLFRIFSGLIILIIGLLIAFFSILVLVKEKVIVNPYIVAADYTLVNQLNKEADPNLDTKHLTKEQEANMISDPTETPGLTQAQIDTIQPYVDIINEANNNISSLSVSDAIDDIDYVYEQIQINLDAKKEMQAVIEADPELKAILMPDKSTAYEDLGIGIPVNNQWENYGDIYYCSKDLQEGKTIPQNGHIAIGYYNNEVTIEGWPMIWSPNLNLPNNGVQIAYNWENYWAAENNCAPAYHLRVYGATPEDYNNAMDYALRNISETYNWSFTYALDGFYCSELGALAWAAAGYDVNSGDDFGQILPVEMLLSPNTFVVPMDEGMK